MPIVTVRLYQEGGRAPFLTWFDRLPKKAKDACTAKLELLRGQGHDLRRPACENLGGGIYELRPKAERVNYRILYFFHERGAVVVSHGFVKQQAEVPSGEIETAKERMRRYQADPEAHTYREG